MTRPEFSTNGVVTTFSTKIRPQVVSGTISSFLLFILKVSYFKIIDYTGILPKRLRQVYFLAKSLLKHQDLRARYMTLAGLLPAGSSNRRCLHIL